MVWVHMTDFPSSVLSFIHLYKVKPLAIKEQMIIISARFWKMMRVFPFVQRKIKVSGTESYDLHNEHGKKSYKVVGLRQQKKKKNHIGFTPRHQAHPWKILMCWNNRT